MNDKLSLMYKNSNIDAKVLAFCSEVETSLAERFAAIDEVAEYNQLKVLAAMRESAAIASPWLPVVMSTNWSSE